MELSSFLKTNDNHSSLFRPVSIVSLQNSSAVAVSMCEVQLQMNLEKISKEMFKMTWNQISGEMIYSSSKHPPPSIGVSF